MTILRTMSVYSFKSTGSGKSKGEVPAAVRKIQRSYKSLVSRRKNSAHPAVVRFLQEWVEYFPGITKAQASSLAKVVDIVRVKSGNYICKMDHIADCLYIVYKGTVATQLRLKSEKVQVLQEFDRRGLVGCSSFMLQVPWRVDAVAVTDCILLALSREDYERIQDYSYFKTLDNMLQHERTKSVVNALEQCSLVATLSTELLFKVSSLFHAIHVLKGSRLDNNEHAADSIYLVSSGELVLAEMDKTGKFESEVARLRPGSCVGERLLLEHPPRKVGTIYAAKDSVLFMLPREALSEFCNLAPVAVENIKKAYKERTNAILVSRKIPFSKSLSEQKLQLLAKLCVLKKYMPNQVILEENSCPAERKLYIVSHGEVSVSVGKKKIRTLREGDYFGEMSLFSSDPVTATVAVSSSNPVMCLVISKPNFQSLFLSEPAVLAEIEIKVLGSKCQLYHVLNHPYARKLFVQHCEKEYAEENVSFWCQVEKLKSLQRRIQRSRPLHDLRGTHGRELEHELLEEAVNFIYAQFITEQAPHEINVSSAKTESITQSFKQGKLGFDMFDGAQKEIYELMDKDSFPRFKASAAFETLLRMLGCYNQRDIREFTKIKADIEQAIREQQAFVARPEVS